MKKMNRQFTVLIFIFLYIPMAVLILGSFNTGKNLAVFEGFTLQQYVRLFQDRSLLKLLGNSVLISVLASGLSTVFGTFAAVGIHGMKPKLRKTVMGLTNIPMTNPDIVTGISLSLLFVFIGTGMLDVACAGLLLEKLAATLGESNNKRKKSFFSKLFK